MGAMHRAWWMRGALATAAIAGACATPKAPLTEPQAPGTYATLLVQCPAVLAESERATRGVFTTEATLVLTIVGSGATESAMIDDPCHREGRPIHVPAGDVKLDAKYEERVRKDNSAVEARVNCELPTVSREVKAGATFVYTVQITRRDANGRFNACSVKLAEMQEAKPSTSATASGSAPSSASSGTSNASP